MSVTVTVELTDGQWALVLEHYKNSVGDAPVTTVEEFQAALMQEIGRTIRKQADRKAREGTQNVFNV